MKKSTQFNFKPTIESTLNSVSPVSRNASHGIDSDLDIDDFDPTFELKRLRQELIERLLIIQRKAALNAQSENQKQLSVTIVPKPIQTSQIHPKRTTNETITKLSVKNQNQINNVNIEIASRNKSSNSNPMPDLLDDPDRSAERIMANIESARACISELQVPNFSQPQLKFIADKLAHKQNYTQTNQQQTENLQSQSQINSQNEQYQTQQFTNKTNSDINRNVNSETPILQSTPTPPTQQILPPKPSFANESIGIILLQKLNIGLSLVGVMGILFGVFYLFNNNTDNLQSGVPVLFVGLVLIVAGFTGHLLQEYVNSSCPINHSSTNT
ncbi:MAG: DUF1129 domain-containing protein [Planctomycetaceae bacterium]|jgi:hypothetical protein|nr:DUF1129 domain-containing protein [Planctomycetaceae bacterium]